MSAPEQFTGFMIQDKEKWTDFKKMKFTPKIFEDNDVDIENECCGCCGSDVHTVTGGWGDLPAKPICVGHEIVGKVLRVGPKVKDIKVGDRVGVGAQIQSCMQCANCKSDNENYCPKQIDTYGPPYMLDEGRSDKPMKDSSGNQIHAQGGYSSHTRAHQQFVFPIPDSIPSEEAGPMMCAGLTTYSPLSRARVGPGSKVGILGIGGLGHFGLLWAKALGAEVWALSHSPDKKADALELGADHFVCTKEKGWDEELAFKFNFILNCADMTNEFDLKTYLATLSVGGEFHNVGLPDKPLPELMAQDFAPNAAKVCGSHIGSKAEALAMLKLAAEKKIHPKIELIDISEKGCAEAVTKVYNNDVRYRVTLVGFKKAFGTNA